MNYNNKMKCENVKIKKYKLTKDDKQLSMLCKALGHEARVMIVKILINRNACVCGDIVEALPLSQSTVSQHLKILKECGIIQGQIKGPSICYCINPETMNQLRHLISSL
jgi:ArsR family transcriptional regulator